MIFGGLEIVAVPGYLLYKHHKSKGKSEERQLEEDVQQQQQQRRHQTFPGAKPCSQQQYQHQHPHPRPRCQPHFDSQSYQYQEHPQQCQHQQLACQRQAHHATRPHLSPTSPSQQKTAYLASPTSPSPSTSPSSPHQQYHHLQAHQQPQPHTTFRIPRRPLPNSSNSTPTPTSISASHPPSSSPHEIILTQHSELQRADSISTLSHLPVANGHRYRPMHVGASASTPVLVGEEWEGREHGEGDRERREEGGEEGEADPPPPYWA